MTTEIILEAAALLLALFCLGYTLRRRGAADLPPGKGIFALLKSRHTVYGGLLCVLAAAAAVSVAEGLALRIGGGTALPACCGRCTWDFKSCCWGASPCTRRRASVRPPGSPRGAGGG